MPERSSRQQRHESLRVAAATALLVLGALGCGSASRAPALTDADHLVGASEGTYSVPGHDGREYILRLPPDYDGTQAIPVVVGFHGGGGKKEGFVRTGCSEGDTSSSNCLSSLADREGFALVLPDGVDGRGLRGRSWNAGGGADGFRCVGGEACATDSDDVAYFDDLVTELRRAVRLDDRRIFAMGMSNGGAMAHRLACERADVVASIAAVSGANQALASPGCVPSRPIAVLHVHGTEDPCWGYDGAILEDLCQDGSDGRFVDVETSMESWRDLNGCAGTTTEPLPDEAADGTTSARIAGASCSADTVLVQVKGGGHTWPSGWQYLREQRIGRVARDFDGNEEIWAFLKAHPR